MNIKELENVINYLQDLRREEEKKQLEKLEEEIKKEIINQINMFLDDFTSDVIIKYMEDTKKDICFTFKSDDIINILKDNIKIDVWMVK